jgi:hypothetical protein
MGKKRHSNNSVGEPGSLGQLIDRLGPLNNTCRASEGIDKVELLWDMGQALLQLMPEANDDLLWTISERSYLTRDILRYALIIRRGWCDRSELRRSFPNLKQYSLFREALPFLKGDRSGVSQEVYEDIVGRLNGESAQKGKRFLVALKAKKIGRKHRKGQAAAKMSDLANRVGRAIEELVSLAARGDERTGVIRTTIGPDKLLLLSQVCMAMAGDEEPPAFSTEAGTWPEPLDCLANGLLQLIRANRDDRAGFRKTFRPTALMEAADLLNALRSDERLAQWKQRRALRLIL